MHQNDTPGKTSIIFFGNERLATGVSTTAPTLRALIAAGYHVAAVVSNYTPAQSRSRRTLEVAEVAKEHDIPVLLPSNLLDIREQLLEYHASVGVLVAYGRIVSSSIIDLFPQGIINIHPSLLPLHRGPTPIESIILDGALMSGVSLMQLAKQMDAGPILAQQIVPLRGNESKQQLADTLLHAGASLLLEHLPAFLAGTLVPTHQDESKATYDTLITKQDGIIDWTKPATQLEREIRAFAFWPQCRTTLGSQEVIINSAQICDKKGPAGDITTGSGLVIYCGEHALEITQLTPVGKKSMSASAFLTGYKQRIQ